MQKIISVQGNKWSGKDTVAKMLQYLLSTPKILHKYDLYCRLKWFKKDYKIVRYADKMKEMLAILLNTNVQNFEDREFKEQYYVDFNTLQLIHVDESNINAFKDKILSDTRFTKEIKRVKRERVYQGTIVDVYKDYMEFSNGNHEVWDYIHHKGAAAVIPVMDDGRLLMVRQYRNALDRFTLELPAGGLDQADEPGRDCSARELEEETGYHSDDLEWLITLRTTVALCNEKIEVYVARNLIRTHQHLDENEFVNVEAHTVEELKQMIFEGKIEDSKTVAAILAYDAKYNR